DHPRGPPHQRHDLRVAQPRHRRRGGHPPGARRRGGGGRGGPGPRGRRLVVRPVVRRARDAPAPLEGGHHAAPRAAGRPDAPGDRQTARRRRARGGAGHRPPRLGRRPRGEGAEAPPRAVGAADGQPGGVGGVPPARRRRGDRTVELPRLHPDGIDRLRARGGQRGGVQAQRVHPRRRGVAGPHLPGDCRPARAPGRDGLRRHRCGAVPGGRRQGRVHRVDHDGQAGDGRLRREPRAGGDRGGREGRRHRRRGRRHRRRRRCHPVGRLLQRRPDLHRRRARLRPRPGVRRVPGRAHREGARPPRRRQPRLADRADHHAAAAGRHPQPHPGRARPRRPGGRGRGRGGGGALRAAHDPRRRARGLPGGAGGDVRPDGHGVAGPRHGRGRRADQRHPLRPGLDGVRRGPGHGDRRADPVGHDRDQRRHLLRRDPLAALRGRRRLRLRPHPRPRRPPRVHLSQGHRAPAVQAGDGADVVHAHREGRPAAGHDHEAPARRRHDDPRAQAPGAV
ncbi:MAG: Aldehyde dehydrogenase, partial [uncultured Nocardioides sp.]